MLFHHDAKDPRICFQLETANVRELALLFGSLSKLSSFDIVIIFNSVVRETEQKSKSDEIHQDPSAARICNNATRIYRN
jgi:hypothetical protein